MYVFYYISFCYFCPLVNKYNKHAQPKYITAGC